MRLTIAASAAATVLYTPLIKRHLLAKNLVVAATIAAAPLAGALAAGAAGAGLRAVLAPTAFLFLGILHREIMMDIQVGRTGGGGGGVLLVGGEERRGRWWCFACLLACLLACWLACLLVFRRLREGAGGWCRAAPGAGAGLRLLLQFWEQVLGWSCVLAGLAALACLPSIARP